ncbi:MAG: hypothetical protein ACC645_17225 [Pirellulales bacterium]
MGHLIEILVEGLDKERDLGEFTQEVNGQSRDNWQVPYDEQLLEQGAGRFRYVFFFHYLDLGKPLLTPLGSVPLPRPTNTPERLESIKYESP